MYYNLIKRFYDIFASFLALIALSPVFFTVMIILFIYNDRKAFFFQDRPGKDAVIFKIIKFKTMNDKKNRNGELLPFKERVSALGLFIRKYSLDEIPQLINVIKGDMSIVGPRPLLVKYLPLYNETQKMRHYVRPGITGWAQVNGRNSISWEQKFKLDVYYVENYSFLMDLNIIFKTVQKLLKTSGVNASENVTMKPFKGLNSNG